jgi:MFS transporter, PPP family, 3-phenylpropionic acid transporter
MNGREDFWIKNGFFFFYAAFGIFVVYLNVYYEQVGLSDVQIGRLSALYPLIGFLVNPFWGMLADRSHDPRRMMMLLLLASGVLFIGMGMLESFLPILALLLVFSIFFSPNTPLIDAFTLGQLSKRGGDYGRLRLWGSLGFIFPAVLMWRLHGETQIRLIFPMFAGFMLIALFTVRKFPPLERPPSRVWPFAAFRVLKSPLVLVFFLTGFLQKFSMSGYYSFFSLYLQDLGFHPGNLGFIWAIGPLAEVASLYIAGSLIAKWGIKRVILLSHAATAVRLWILAAAPPLGLLLASQCLHALTFGTMHAASMAFIGRLGRDDNRAALQGLYYALCMQLSMILGHATAGMISEHFGRFALYKTYGMVALSAFVIFALFFTDGKVEGKG